jgi:hypothetical protein
VSCQPQAAWGYFQSLQWDCRRHSRNQEGLGLHVVDHNMLQGFKQLDRNVLTGSQLSL